jgi:hypothetical protein
MRIAFSLAALLAAAGGAYAATPPVKAAAPATTLAAQPIPVRFPGVSEAGNAVLTKAQSTPDPQLQTLARQLRTIRDQLTTAVMAPVIDVDKVSEILRQQDGVQSQIRTEQTERWIAVFKQLPSGDRGTVLRTMRLAKPRQPAAAATPQP